MLVTLGRTIVDFFRNDIQLNDKPRCAHIPSDSSVSFLKQQANCDHFCTDVRSEFNAREFVMHNRFQHNRQDSHQSTETPDSYSALAYNKVSLMINFIPCFLQITLLVCIVRVNFLYLTFNYSSIPLH